MGLKFIPQDNAINQINSELFTTLVKSQGASFEREFSTAYELCQRAFEDLHLALDVPEDLKDSIPTAFADNRFSTLIQFFRNFLEAQGLSPDTIPHLTVSLAQRIHLLRAFAQPKLAVQGVIDKVEDIVKGFPRSAEDIQRGKNPGDVLDPYILAATQTLLYSGNFEKAVAATVAHKAL